MFSIEVLLGLPVRRSEPESRVLPHHELGEALVLVGWGVVGIMIARAVVDPMPRYLGSLPDLHANPGTPFSFVAVAAATLRTLGLTYYLNTLFTAFGPMLCLLVVRWQLVARHLGEEPFHVWMLLVALCFASCGGTDTVRFASWGSPVVHLLYLLALGSYWSDLRPCARSPGQLALLILAVSATLGGQLVCSFFFSLATSDALGLGRVLLQINLGQRECCLERFVLYACLTLGLALLLRHVEDHLRSGPGRSEQPRSPACFAESAL
ncbi:MAG: hypothetical protein HY815_25920 [Candidatus Riflebacteria bacterium]|nr:hypothetical protein [Candidatus Riflebacteria bacterium]